MDSRVKLSECYFGYHSVNCNRKLRSEIVIVGGDFRNTIVGVVKKKGRVEALRLCYITVTFILRLVGGCGVFDSSVEIKSVLLSMRADTVLGTHTHILCIYCSGLTRRFSRQNRGL